MELTQNQGVIDYRSKLRDRMRSKYPDRNFGNEGGQDATDDLDMSLAESFDEYDNKIKTYDENNEKLKNLFNSSPKSAAFLNSWVRTHNPAISFREVFGKNAYDALMSEEGAKMLAEIEQKENEDKAAKDARDAETTENFRKSLETLKAFGERRGLDEDGQFALLTSLMDMLSDAEDGIYSDALLESAWKAQHYDSDVESARHEGEVNGRNAKIQESQMRRQQAQAMPPAMSGRAARVSEAPAPKKWGDFLK